MTAAVVVIFAVFATVAVVGCFKPGEADGICQYGNVEK